MESQTIYYLENGQSCELVSILEKGFLIRPIIQIVDYDDEEGEITGDTIFVDAIYKIAPTSKHSEIIEGLNKEIDKKNVQLTSINEEINKLDLDKRKAEQALKSVSKIKNLDLMVKYLNDDYKFTVDDYFDISESSSRYHTRNIALFMVNGSLEFYTLNSDRYTSEKTRVMPFNTIEEAEKYRTEEVLKRINSWTSQYHISEFRDGYRYRNVVAIPQIKEAIELRLEQLKTKDKTESLERLKTEFAKITTALELAGVNIVDLIKLNT